MLGAISFGPEEQQRLIPFKGEQYLPSGAKIYFYAYRPMAEHPELFDGFGPDELYSVRLQDLAGSEIVSDLNWNDNDFAHIARLTGLRELELIDASPTGVMCADLDRLTHLESLALLGQRADISWLANLHRLSKLKILRMSEAINVTPILQKLAGTNNLQKLVLEHCNVNMDQLNYVLTIKSINDLCLNDNAKVTDDAIPRMAVMPNLTKLAVARTSVTPAFIFKLSLLKKLKIFGISHNLLTERQQKYVEYGTGRHIELTLVNKNKDAQ
jgi:hypothetical protein